MIKLRKLEKKDIPFMLEWMHDIENEKIFQNDFYSMNEKKCEEFIKNSFTTDNQHFAIVNDLDDEYLGTISLKNINYKNMNAEYAISTRKKIRGTGCALSATKTIIKYGFDELRLNKIYLNVLTSNERAKCFYKKVGFQYEGTFKKHILINNKYEDLEWYGIIDG